MSEFNNIELLEKYFNYELNEEDDALFKTKLASDEAFKEAYEIALVLRAKELKNRKAIYKHNVQNDISTGIKIISVKKYWPLLAAAVVLIFIGMNWLIGSSEKATDIMADHLNAHNAVSIDSERSGTNEYRNKAIKAFNGKIFLDAIYNFEQLENVGKLKDTDKYYLGLCHLYAEQYAMAIKRFSTVSEQHKLNQQAKWYEALAHINLNQNVKAKLILENLLAKKNLDLQNIKVTKKQIKVLLKELDK